MLCLSAKPVGVEHTPLSVLLDRVGAELGCLSASVDDLQDQLGTLLMHAVQDKPHAIVHVQKLDALAQTLASLSGFMQALGPKTIGNRPVDLEPLVDTLTLTDLADRLRGHAGADAPDDFELF